MSKSLLLLQLHHKKQQITHFFTKQCFQICNLEHLTRGTSHLAYPIFRISIFMADFQHTNIRQWVWRAEFFSQ